MGLVVAQAAHANMAIPTETSRSFDNFDMLGSSDEWLLSAVADTPVNDLNIRLHTPAPLVSLRPGWATEGDFV
jgi:hypothetical protein